MIRKSLCCISLELQKQGLRANTMTRKRFLSLERKQALSILSQRVINNLEVVLATIKYCSKHGWNYRISSDIFPLATLPDANLSYDILPNKTVVDKLYQDIADCIKSNNIRCSTHPDQFVVPASSNPTVAAKSVIELTHHADLMDRMCLPRSYDAPINIHMNCFKGSLPNIAKRFIEIYKTLPDGVKSRLVLELEDKPNSWGLINLYNLIYQKTGIPITYDSHHFRLNNPENISPEKAILMCMETWGKYKPLFHYSNGRSDPTDRAHSDYVYILHKELFENDVDVEFEFKAKDQAILHFERSIQNKISPNC